MIFITSGPVLFHFHKGLFSRKELAFGTETVCLWKRKAVHESFQETSKDVLLPRKMLQRRKML